MAGVKTGGTAFRDVGNHHYMKTGGHTILEQASSLETVAYPDLASRAQAMHDDGFVFFPDALSPREVQELRAAMDVLGEDDPASFQRRGHYGKTDDAAMASGYFDKHIACPFLQDDHFLRYFDRPGIIEVVESIHGPDCRVIGGSVWVTGPGRYPMGLHVDYQPFGLPEDIAQDPRVQIPIFISTLHFYLNDMSMDVGPTVLIPGSHRAGRAPSNETSWNGQEAQALMTNAGDAMLFRSDIWHGALGNSSNEKRYMLQVHYGNVYMDMPYKTPFHKRQLSNQVLNQASARQRRLFGERSKDDTVQRGSYVQQRVVLPPRGKGTK